MATKHDTSKARSGRNSAAAKARSADSSPKSAKAVPNLERLEDIVEDERARLMKAHSILDCVITAMEDEEGCTSDGPYWPSVIESARDLINESIRRLEDLDCDRKPARSKNEVREPVLDWPLMSSEAAERADIAAALAPLAKDRRLN